MRRSLLIAALIALVLLDISALLVGLILLLSAVLIEHRVSLPAVLTLFVGFGLLWLTVVVARACRTPAR